MALAKWNDSYSVKVEKHDAQHQDVFEMINNLADAMRKGQGAAAIQPTLNRLIRHIHVHLQDEEDMMRQCGYPELAAHQEEHRRYMLRVERFKADFEETNKEDTVAMLHILRDLILNHILRTDLAYSAYMNADGIR